MLWGPKLRHRRVSKKGLTLLLLCGIVLYYLSLLLYSRTLRVHLVSNVNVIVQQPEQQQQQLQQQQQQHSNKQTEDTDPEPEPPPAPKLQPQPPPPPVKIGDQPVASVALKQNVAYMENILSKMEQSMKKDETRLERELAGLPRPEQLLAAAAGPVPRVAALQPAPVPRESKVSQDAEQILF